MNSAGVDSPWVALAERVGIALVHSLWQGAFVGLVLMLGLVALRRARAQVRYLACCLALVTTLLLPVCTFFALPADRVASPRAEGTRGHGSTFVASAAAALEAAASLLPEELAGSATEPPGGPAHQPGEPAPRPAGQAAQIAPVRGESENAELQHVGAEDQAAVAAAWLSPPAKHLLLAIVAAWSVGVVILSCRVLGGYVVARRLTRRLLTPLDEGWPARLGELARRLGIERPIELWQSAAVEVPAVIGCFRPVVLLPVGMLTGLSVAHVESILAHELAHIRRHDFLVNAVQSLIETLLFYHPCVWWMSARIRAEREHCCDETAVAVCGDALVYARALTGLEELRPPARLAMALSGGGPLLYRIRRIVGQPRSGDVIGGWLAGSLAIILPLAIGGTWAWERTAWGRVEPTQREPTAAMYAAVADARPADRSTVASSAGDEPSEPSPAPGHEGPSGFAKGPAESSSGQGAPAGAGLVRLGDSPTVGFLVLQRPGFNGTRDDLLPRMLEEHGSRRVVQVVVTGVPAEAHNDVYGHLWRLLPNLTYFGTGGGDTVTVHLAPVDDLDAFAARIDLGQIRSIDREKRLISVVADRARLPRRQAPAVAEGVDLATLCQRLAEQDPTAVDGLVAFGAEAEAAVAPYVGHEERRVRRAALLVLKRVATEASLPVLLSALADADLGNRDLAWQAICKVPGLSTRREVMEAAVAALARQGEQASKWLATIGPSAEALVWPSLRHDDPGVRLAAVSAIAQIGTSKSLPALEALMADEVEEVARAAEKARAAIARR